MTEGRIEIPAAEPTKAYYVTEREHVRKQFLVFANTVEEAKEHVRKGTGR